MELFVSDSLFLVHSYLIRVRVSKIQINVVDMC